MEEAFVGLAVYLKHIKTLYNPTAYVRRILHQGSEASLGYIQSNP